MALHWRKLVAVLSGQKKAGSCSLISPVTWLSLPYYERRSRKYRWIPPQSPGLLTMWQTDHSLWDWRGCVSEKVISCTVTPQGLYSVYCLLESHSFSSHCTPQTSNTTQSPVISKNIQITQQLLDASVMDHKLSTGNWSVPLWHGEGTITFFWTKTTQNKCLWTRNKPNIISILGEEAEVVENYRCFGVYLDSRLNYECNIFWAAVVSLLQAHATPQWK